MDYNLATAFFRQAKRRPDALALNVAGASLSYAQLSNFAQRIGSWLRNGVGLNTGRVGILASRSLEAYAGILGTSWVGAAYIPISPKIPEERLIRILQIIRPDALIADRAGLNCLSERVSKVAPPRILSHHETFPQPGGGLKETSISISPLATLSEARDEMPIPLKSDALAYIIFTSGTTGTPKGVMVESGSVHQLITVTQQKYGFRSSDRVSQVSELTFDVSVFDMFMTWGAGASLHVVPASQLLCPSRFIRDNQLTIWFSVPSTALFMQRMKVLKPGTFPTLRYSLFAGEALPLASARAWQAAAPNSIVDNLYGPTEATVVCIGQRLTDPPRVTETRGVLAIGEPFDGVTAAVLDSGLNCLSPGCQGELAVSGRQLARGYFDDPELTNTRFPTLRGTRWYRTGDLVYQDSSGAFHHLGRIDNQVKILGNRVELEEVEAHLRDITNTDLVAAVAWPTENGNASGIVAFHRGNLSTGEIRQAMKKRVPIYMVPNQVHYLETLPLSSSGKIDRKALVRLLEEDFFRNVAQQP